MNSSNYLKKVFTASLKTILLIVLLCAWIVPVSAQGYWRTLADTPGEVRGGGALASGSIYALRGDSSQDFWRFVFSYRSSSVVGGFYAPINSFTVLLPYLALVGLLGIMVTVLVKRKRFRN